MASILVYIEPSGHSPASIPRRASLEALGEGRRIADALGATLHAFAPMMDTASGTDTAPAPDAGGVQAAGALVDTLARGGADRVVLVPAGAGPATWATHGAALCAAYERVQPLLVLLAATRAGRDLAPRLAARAQAAFVPEPSILGGPEGEVVLRRSVYDDALRRQVSLEGLERAAVVTLTPGSYPRAHGAGEVPALVPALVHAPAPATRPGIEYLDSSADPGAALDTARVIVVAGAGVCTAEVYDLVGALASALGGTLGATPALCARGLAPPHLAIGIGARHVAPALYVVCAASGSSAHLGAVSRDAEIIAINADPEAPVFRAASYGIVGRLEQVVPALIEALQDRTPAAVTS